MCLFGCTCRAGIRGYGLTLGAVITSRALSAPFSSSICAKVVGNRRHWPPPHIPRLISHIGAVGRTNPRVCARCVHSFLLIFCEQVMPTGGHFRVPWVATWHVDMRALSGKSAEVGGGGGSSMLAVSCYIRCGVRLMRGTCNARHLVYMSSPPHHSKIPAPLRPYTAFPRQPLPVA